jgi:hypothetical protein
VAGIIGAGWAAVVLGELDGLDGRAGALVRVAGGLDRLARPDAADADGALCDPHAASSAAASAPPPVTAATVTARRAARELAFMGMLPSSPAVNLLIPLSVWR